MKNYITIKQDEMHEQTISKSRFLTHIFKVSSEEEAKEKIEEIKAANKQATHNCSAYVIGDQHQIQKANDDGEPSGTAGVPMLETLKKENIHNAVAIVTRYYGGIKLGAGGLIRAYQSGVTEAIKASGKVSIESAFNYSVSLPYDLTGKYEHELKNAPYQLQSTDYTDKVTYTLFVKAEDAEAFETFTMNQTGGAAQIHQLDALMLPFDIE